jgi:hypothetical protein
LIFFEEFLILTDKKQYKNGFKKPRIEGKKKTNREKQKMASGAFFLIGTCR